MNSFHCRNLKFLYSFITCRDVILLGPCFKTGERNTEIQRQGNCSLNIGTAFARIRNTSKIYSKNAYGSRQNVIKSRHNLSVPNQIIYQTDEDWLNLGIAESKYLRPQLNPTCKTYLFCEEKLLPIMYCVIITMVPWPSTRATHFQCVHVLLYFISYRSRTFSWGRTKYIIMYPVISGRCRGNQPKPPSILS